MTSSNKRVLLAVTGLSPQVVTETLYAIYRSEGREAVPTEIHLVTTIQGADHARLSLLSEDPGWFHRFCRDYGFENISFGSHNIHVLTDAKGHPLADIRSPEDNRRAADTITEIVRSLTADPATALHVSIAGGRKTMGFYLGYALSLFGRPQDQLSHVLVSSPFESHPQFFYPTPYERVIHTLDKSQVAVDCRNAEVTLAEIPIVSLRHGLPQNLLAGCASYTDVVAAARRSLTPPKLRIDKDQRQIEAGGETISLPSSELALLAVFVRRAMNAEPALTAPPKDGHDMDWAERYLFERRAIAGSMADLDQCEHALRKGMDGDYFSTLLSKLRRRIKARLGPAATPYLIDDGGSRPRHYRLALPPDALEMD